jgi:magnesium-protoporphyrin IX monomethyl ester (oxidative) cyclase
MQDSVSVTSTDQPKDGTISALLINPPTPLFMSNKEYQLPPALMYLASYAQQFGFTVKIVDLNINFEAAQTVADQNEYYLGLIRQAVQSENPAVVGVGCLFSGQFPFVDLALARIKELRPDVVTCTGGIHPTIFAKNILENCPHIDFVVIGEGEEQFVEIIRRALSGDLSGDMACDGIGFRQDGRVVVKPKKGFQEDLDALPLPAYHLVDFDDYRADLSKWHNPKGQFFDISIPLISSRSCPNRCNFCSMFLVMGPKFRARSAGNIVKEIELLYNEYGVRHFSFMDDNLTFSKGRTLEICGEIVRRGLDFQFDTPNGLMVRTLDEEVISALVSAGWVRGSIAIESGSDYIRNKVIGKRLSEEKIFEVLHCVDKYPQVFLRAYFIMGFPEDTPETLDDSVSLIERMHIDDIYVNNLLPFPGTKLFDQCVRDNLLLGFDANTIWRAEDLYYTGNKRFFVKPYAMDLSTLKQYRETFDTLLARKQAEAKARRAARAATGENAPSS